MKAQTSRFDVIGQLDSLRRYARSLTRNEADAEDLVQDTLVRAYEKRSHFRQGGNLKGWLLSILHNSFIDNKRSNRSEAGGVEAMTSMADTSLQPSQEQSLHLSDIRRAFFALPEEQRAALHLVAIENLSYEEAAATLGIPTGTLMSRISRARAALRLLEGEPQAGKTARLRIVGGRDE
jgi:RNA polymerase sigma-70 factor (ECF subfamily)